MAIVKCQNPECNYFQKPVPEGDFCPFCGESLPTKQTSVRSVYPPVQPPPFQTIITELVEPETQPSLPEPSPTTIYEDTSPYPILKLIHTSGQEFLAIGDKRVYIGRRGGTKKPQPEIDLTDIPYSERVSRPHAHIFWDERKNHYMIVDNQSTNGTMINGEFINPWHPYSLDDGAILELGKEHYIKFTIKIC